MQFSDTPVASSVSLPTFNPTTTTYKPTEEITSPSLFKCCGSHSS
ncbi:hypothetical protein A2U01_0081988, partial [Trifolium medium]|nr:hypothetical protein [Trifolium medium]